MNKKTCIIVLLIICRIDVYAYRQPLLNFGLTSFLDGGPIRPNPGIYWEEYFLYYHAHKFRGGNGQLLSNHTPLNSFFIINELIYQAPIEILGGEPGIDFFLPTVPYSHLAPNNFGIRDSGKGIGDLYLGLLLQFNPIKHHDRTILVHRIELPFSSPTGKARPGVVFNPGNGFFFFNPYWAGTLYFTDDWAISWRIHYLWNAENKKEKTQAGQATNMNFTTEYQVIENLWAGINGYLIYQFTDDKRCGISIPNSKERVYSLGPGALYKVNDDFYLFFNLYFEFKAQNRAQGVEANFRLFMHF